MPIILESYPKVLGEGEHIQEPLPSQQRWYSYRCGEEGPSRFWSLGPPGVTTGGLEERSLKSASREQRVWRTEKELEMKRVPSEMSRQAGCAWQAVVGHHTKRD